MAVYKYTSNKDELDGTEVVRLEDGREMRMGDEVELSDKEHEQLKERHNLRRVQEEDGSEESVGEQREEDGVVYQEPSRP
jgi:hypothetical protein